MKSPLWILNSALAAVLVGLALVIFIMRPHIPARSPITPSGVVAIGPEVMPRVDPSQIYKHDLFATYAETKQPTEEVIVKKTVVPQPPMQKVTPAATSAPVQFLPPLAISIKGIIYSHHESENRAIIADAKTKRESLHKIGDKILDAEIIYIGSNKVMLIRSNGQQETLFVTQLDAERDPIYTKRTSWDTVIQKTNDNEYAVYQDGFAEQVPSLAQFIEMLDVTTAFHKGQILGCRIGRSSDSPLAGLLGLQAGDIVTAVNGIPTTTTKKRVAIYSLLKEIDTDTEVVVSAIRNGQLITLKYLIRVVQKEPTSIKNRSIPNNRQDVKQQDAAVITHTTQRVPEYAATVQNVQKRDKTAMFNHGGRSALLDTMQP